MVWRRWLPWAALAVVVVVALAVATVPKGTQSLESHVRSIASELRCMECQGLSIADASSPTAEAAKADIKARIQRGESDDEIKAAYVAVNGEFVLLRPEGSGISLIVWVLPLAVLVVGAVGIGFAIRRWRREPRLAATAADAELVEEARRADPLGETS